MVRYIGADTRARRWKKGDIPGRTLNMSMTSSLPTPMTLLVPLTSQVHGKEGLNDASVGTAAFVTSQAANPPSPTLIRYPELKAMSLKATWIRKTFVEVRIDEANA